MSNIENKQDSETDRECFRRRRLRELACSLIYLGASKEKVRAKLKKYLIRRCSFEADALMDEVDQRVASCTLDETEAEREGFEEKKVRELASNLLKLHIGTERRGKVMQSFKEYLYTKYARDFTQEMDRAMADYKAEPTERRPDKGA